MRYVVLPQAIKRMIPPFMNESIIQLKNTSLVSTIAVADLLYQGTIITAATYRPLEVYTMVTVVYFPVLFPLTLAAQQVERRLAHSLKRTPGAPEAMIERVRGFSYASIASWRTIRARVVPGERETA
jgi:ABC-type arginine transport system permease subunit